MVAVVVALTVVAFLSSYSLSTYLPPPAPKTYSAELSISSPYGGSQTITVPTQEYQQPTTENRVSKAMMINAMYTNLTRTNSPYHLTVSSPSTVGYGTKVVFPIQLSYSSNTSPPYSPSLNAFLINPQQLVAAAYPANSTVVNNPNEAYPPTPSIAVGNAVLINSTQLNDLQNGDFAFDYVIPNTNLSVGSWEVFVFLTTSGHYTPSAPIGWSASLFTVSPPVKVVPAQVTESLVANVIGLGSTWLIVYQGTLSLGRRIIAVPSMKWEWFKEHLPFTIGLVLLVLFLLLKYILPIFL